MKKIIKSAKMDENFYTLPKHIPDIYTATNRAVTNSMIDMMKTICNNLEVDFEDIGWNIMRKKEFRQFKDNLCEFIEDYLYQQGVK